LFVRDSLELKKRIKKMTDVDNQMGKLPHPFVNGEKMKSMNGQLVAIVGKVERVENSSFTIKTTDGKSSESQSTSISLTGQ